MGERNTSLGSAGCRLHSVPRSFPATERRAIYCLTFTPCAPLALGSFQQEGVRKGLEFGGRCLIADEMGLGKTVQVCMSLNPCACYASCSLRGHTRSCRALL